MIFAKGQPILVTEKQCQHTLGKPQHKKKFLHVSFDMGFTTMLRTSYKNVIVVKDKVVYHLTKNEMHSVPVSPHIKKHFGLDLYSLPEVSSYRHLVACNDYFTKWLEANPIREKKVLTVATFLYELMSCHGCFKAK